MPDFKKIVMGITNGIIVLHQQSEYFDARRKRRKF
jgi:hypothetical protein